MKSLFQLSFFPKSADCALLLLRVWFGLTMFLHHGLGKLSHFSAIPNPLGMPATVNSCLVVLAEVVCSACLVLGLATRLAALILVIEMGVAFWCVHGHSLAQGELAFLNLGAFLAILFAGPGKMSVDGA